MSNFDIYNKDVDSNEEIDYNFFEDNANDLSETNVNEAIVSNKIERESVDSKRISNEKNSSHNSKSKDISLFDDLDVMSLHSAHSSDYNSSKNSSSSASKSHLSELSKKSSSAKMSASQELSASPQSSLHRSPSESDVTTVSSLDSEPKRNASVTKKSRSRESTQQGQSKHITHIDNPEDVDRVQPEAILRAMIRIHEERRVMRQLRPKWVDPNTKDYSVSGLTAKMNLVPEKIVSAQKKNIRDNPFYMHFNKPSQRPYHTALNREKELDRIEKENRAIYDRIKKVRPSPGITKQELLREYTKSNRFSMSHNLSPYAASLSTSYRTLATSNSRSSSQARRTHSSASLQNHKSEADQTLVSRKYSNSRVMSANSLTSTSTRINSSVCDQRRLVKKSRY